MADLVNEPGTPYSSIAADDALIKFMNTALNRQQRYAGQQWQLSSVSPELRSALNTAGPNNPFSTRGFPTQSVVPNPTGSVTFSSYNSELLASYSHHTPDLNFLPHNSHYLGTTRPAVNYQSSELSLALMDPAIPRNNPPNMSGQSTAISREPPTATGGDEDNRSKRRKYPTAIETTKITGACTRCKRVKMKCTFPDNASSCARCLAGGHECLVLGRKPRSPGVNEILRKQIKEKDAMIDDLLHRLNPTPSLATPLSLNLSRLALTASQRVKHRDVLAWFERPQNKIKSCRELKSKVKLAGLQPDDEDNFSDDEDSDTAGGSGSPAAEELDEPTVTHRLTLPEASAPAGLLASTVIHSRQRSVSVDPGSDEDEEVDMSTERGVGSRTYFDPGPSSNPEMRRLIIERQAAPDILLCGLVSLDEVDELFTIYFRWINPSLPVLDENIHTPAAVLGRCPFLFTVVCALASQFYDAKPEIYDLAMHIAKSAAANAFLDGWKTVEMCQAYIILGGHTPPAKRWEEDRFWFYSGIAFRLAIELNLNRLPPVSPSDERAEREQLNRMRTWLNCFTMDRYACVNLCKPCMIPDDEALKNASKKFSESQYHNPGDMYVVGLSEILRITSHFCDHVRPLLEANDGKENTDMAAVHAVILEMTEWNRTRTKNLGSESEESEHKMQVALLTTIYHHCRLVVYSAVLRFIEKADGLGADQIFFSGCIDAASSILEEFLQGIVPSGYLRYSPEHLALPSAFALAVLGKCFKPTYAHKLSPSEREGVTQLVKRFIKVLDSEKDAQISSSQYLSCIRNILAPYILRSGCSNQNQFKAIATPSQSQQFQPATSQNTNRTAMMIPGMNHSFNFSVPPPSASSPGSIGSLPFQFTGLSSIPDPVFQSAFDLNSSFSLQSFLDPEDLASMFGGQQNDSSIWYM
ncbi:hypothetical protein C8Q75DRAFT_803748 [Abortiporus biennis]|nr:hypothetical protein C8Q75DRAFT_803748 [Abortiporus biennis]